MSTFMGVASASLPLGLTALVLAALRVHQHRAGGRCGPGRVAPTAETFTAD